MPLLAGHERLVELAPMIGAVLARVGPMRAGVLLGNRGIDNKRRDGYRSKDKREASKT